MIDFVDGAEVLTGEDCHERVIRLLDHYALFFHKRVAGEPLARGARGSRHYPLSPPKRQR